MILARVISTDRLDELGFAFARLGLPAGARDYLIEKVPRLAVLLTGLSRVEGRFLGDLAERCETPGEEFPLYVAGDQAKRPGTGLLLGRRDQLRRLADEARALDELAELHAALGSALATLEPPRTFRVGARTFELGARTHVMGIVNVTPDSFSDGGRFLDPRQAIAHGEALVAAGADVLDVGGESTRPGAPEVDAQEELRRVLPVVEGLRGSGVPVSIDTTKADVARAALAAGAAMVNDISALAFDPALAKVVAEAGAACCLMHIQGTPRTMQADPRYGDVVEEVLLGLRSGVERALAAGIARDRLLVDPGIGFGKTVGHNLTLLRRLGELRALGLPILVGASRKSFLGKLTGGKAAPERVLASAVVAARVAGSADFVRVHDVAETREALAVADAVRTASEAGDQAS